MSYYAITGRVHGDDEDVTMILQAGSGVDPRRIEGRLIDEGVEAIDILKGVGS